MYPVSFPCGLLKKYFSFDGFSSIERNEKAYNRVRMGASAYLRVWRVHTNPAALEYFYANCTHADVLLLHVCTLNYRMTHNYQNVKSGFSFNKVT